MRRWWALPARTRGLLLLGGYALVAAATLALGLRSTPYALLYLYLMAGVCLATFAQACALTLLVVVTTLAMALWPPLVIPHAVTLDPLTQGVAAEMFIALTAVALAAVLQQRRLDGQETASMGTNLRVLRALGTYALTRLSREELLRTLCAYILDTRAADMVMLVMADETRTLLRGYVAYGDRPDTVPVQRPVAGTLAGAVFLSCRTHIVNDPRTEPGVLPELVRNGNAILGVPLLLGGLCIGVLYVSYDGKHTFSAADVALVETLAQAIAVPLYASVDVPEGVRGTNRAEQASDPLRDPAQKGTL